MSHHHHHHQPHRSSRTKHRVNTDIEVIVNGRTHVVTMEKREEFRQKRLSSGAGILHDLLSDSLVPLIDELSNHDEIIEQAARFFSAFIEKKSPLQALWKVDVSRIPYRQGEVIYGSNEKARDERIMRRFSSFRFPYVRFEWHIETPYYVWQNMKKDTRAEIKVLWKAWTRDTAASGLVAYGFITDTIRQTGDFLLIENRLFDVTNVVQAELMTPVPYLPNIRPLSRQSDFIIFTTSKTVIQMLRTGQTRMAFLVALSALLTSVKPIVDRFSVAGGWVLAGVGITAAMISVIYSLVTWILTWIQANAAKHRQVVT